MTTPNPEEIDYKNPPFPLTAIDRQLLATKDSDYHRITWIDLKQIIAKNTLEDLKRLPSDLKRYLAWSHNIKAQYGSITTFVIRERLRWTPEPSPSPSSTKPGTPSTTDSGPPLFAHHSPIPFADERDYAVLPNDWPYGFEPGITHLLVWTKTRIPVDEVRGDVTGESRQLVEEFVARFFVRDLRCKEDADGDGADARERVQWFKNWVGLQSVRGVDHVHVLVKDVPQGVLEKWAERRDL
ncbi:hypothetical protein LTR78_003292 [Recurvomyces mirabilis]|uniref:N-acetylglucosamine-induced protein 1 n=1 Tax=Recurvomyces mirabilis TaxID=574656 RepID=A0AAE1C3T1_9PEZI|nr:hypothetical protein LTR78_003292 [Recurvomyces mirabilis]KAK5156891.1 hypothetical protein LTS14_004408 [Recurvomyces mirabilis]